MSVVKEYIKPGRHLTDASRPSSDSDIQSEEDEDAQERQKMKQGSTLTQEDEEAVELPYLHKKNRPLSAD